MTLNTPPQLSSPLLEPFLSNAVPPEPTLAPAQLGKITGYVTCMGHGYRWSRYRYGLEIPTHQKPLPTGQVGTGWCGFFSSNLYCHCHVLWLPCKINLCKPASKFRHCLLNSGLPMLAVLLCSKFDNSGLPMLLCCRKNAMCMWETSGWVGKRMRVPWCIYTHFILLRMYVCQYDAWKGTLVWY